jgi:hypothetical protein
MQPSRPQRRLALLLLLAALLWTPAQATVLQDLSFDELVAQSQLIFRGEALRSATETDSSGADRLVYTRVWFRVDAVLVGDAPAAEFSLRFVGGSANGVEVEVAGQYVPAVGDHAVWFVRDANDTLVNPLTGWYQGAFLINTAADGTLMLDLSQRPDLILTNTRADPLARKMLNTGYSEDRIAARVPGYQRFPLQDFEDAIRSMAGAPP